MTVLRPVNSHLLCCSKHTLPSLVANGGAADTSVSMAHAGGGDDGRDDDGRRQAVSAMPNKQSLE